MEEKMKLNSFKKTNYKIKKINNFYMSIFLLIGIILITGGIYGYNYYLETKNNDLDEQIKIKENSISSLEQDPNIVAYSLYNLNKSSFNKLENYSKQSIFIDHLHYLQKKYKIKFKGYKFSNGRLSTTVISSSDTVGGNLNYKKTSNFIKEYRLEEDALFDLGFVKSINIKDSGANNIFNIDLELKNNINNILQKIESNKKKLEQQRIEAEKIAKEKRIEKLKQLKEEKLKNKQLKQEQ